MAAMLIAIAIGFAIERKVSPMPLITAASCWCSVD
jgi:hypothetical protein